jgi:GDP-4-dehydro-6-deoxy-D-mannose reductase
MSGKALVTGARGFVGRVLCDYLGRQGWDVIGTELHPQDPSPTLVACDITRGDEVERLFDRARDISHVFHLAAVTYVPDSQRDPMGAFDANLLGTIRLLQAVEANVPHASFVFVSTSEVYGPPHRLPVEEAHSLNPANPYAISKAAADAFCAYFQRSFNLDVIRVRPFNHSGAGQSHQFVLSSFAHQVAKIEAGLEPPVLHVGNLSAARDFLHVDDVVRAYELVALEGTPGEAYNVCRGKSRRIEEAVDMLRARARVPIEVTVDPGRLRPHDVPDVYGSYAKLEGATGWRPEIPFERIVDDLLKYWRGQMELEL